MTTRHIPQGSMNEAIRLACLFAADKYRKAADLGVRLSNETITREADTRRGALEYAAAHLPVVRVEDAPGLVLALDALADDMNRTMQNIMSRGAINDAGIFETRLREIYAARASLSGIEETAAESAAG